MDTDRRQYFAAYDAERPVVSVRFHSVETRALAQSLADEAGQPLSDWLVGRAVDGLMEVTT